MHAKTPKIPSSVTIIQYLLLRDIITENTGPLTTSQMRAKHGALLRLRDAFRGYDPRS